jgi:hypothetical protein
MATHESMGREVAKAVGWFTVHALATVIGAVLMVVGIGLGVGLVTLPLAIPVGFAGLFICLWGLFSREPEEEPVPPRLGSP